jgi:hypothetical protein
VSTTEQCRGRVSDETGNDRTSHLGGWARTVEFMDSRSVQPQAAVQVGPAAAATSHRHGNHDHTAQNLGAQHDAAQPGGAPASNNVHTHANTCGPQDETHDGTSGQAGSTLTATNQAITTSSLPNDNIRYRTDANHHDQGDATAGASSTHNCQNVQQPVAHQAPAHGQPSKRSPRRMSSTTRQSTSTWATTTLSANNEIGPRDTSKRSCSC